MVDSVQWDEDGVDVDDSVQWDEDGVAVVDSVYCSGMKMVLLYTVDSGEQPGPSYPITLGHRITTARKEKAGSRLVFSLIGPN